MRKNLKSGITPKGLKLTNSYEFEPVSNDFKLKQRNKVQKFNRTYIIRIVKSCCKLEVSPPPSLSPDIGRNERLRYVQFTSCFYYLLDNKVLQKLKVHSKVRDNWKLFKNYEKWFFISP